MHKLILFIISLLFAVTGLQAQSFDSLKKEYDAFVKKDLPQDAIAVLEKIQQKAQSERSDWYFYWASHEKNLLSSRKDWKHFRDYEKKMQEELKAYASPVVDMYQLRNKRDELKSFVKANAEILKTTKSDRFYSDRFRYRDFMFSPVLPSFIDNDYEFGLWMLMSGDLQISSDLREYFGDRYPQSAFVEFANLKTEAEFESFRKRFEGRAVALLAQAHLLQSRFDRLENDELASSSDFIKLREDCLSCSKLASSLSGAEKKIASCCETPKTLVEVMDKKDVNCSIENSVVTIVSRNASSVSFFLKDEAGKEVLERHLAVPGSKYYVQDTLTINLPALDDGLYTFQYGFGPATELSKPENYEKYSLSFSWRTDSRGTGIFVADQLSGKPLETVDLELVSGNESQKFKGILLKDGFAYLPSGVVLHKNSKMTLMCTAQSGRKLRSRTVTINASPSYADAQTSLSALILTDKGAYTPEETVRFKAVLYLKGTDMARAEEGTRAIVFLVDPDGKICYEETFPISGMSSLNGSLSLKALNRTGFCRLGVKVDGNILTEQLIRVDEFVLPNFDIEWASSGALVPDEEGKVCLKGRIVSASGRPLDSSLVSYTLHVNSDETVTKQGPLSVDSMGNFCLVKRIQEDAGWTAYSLTVKITDLSGEVKEFSNFWTYSKPEKETKASHCFERVGKETLPCVRVTAGNKTAWVMAEIFGTGGHPLERKLVKVLTGKDGTAQSEIAFPYRNTYPEMIVMALQYFQDGQFHSESFLCRMHPEKYVLPMEFTRFTDFTSPGKTASFRVHTLPEVEACLSVYDKSADQMHPCVWESQTPLSDASFCMWGYRSSCGCDKSHRFSPMYMIRGNAKESIDYQNVGIIGYKPSSNSSPAVRSDFRTVLAWEPELRSGTNGDIDFDFVIADKLSTFAVQLFAHDATMRNAALRREILVTLPVQISAFPPRYLYDTDTCLLRFSLSNNYTVPVSGVFTIEGESRGVTIPAKGSLPVSFELSVDGLAGTAKELVAVFHPDGEGLAGDALKLSIPVREPRQTLTESHSAVLQNTSDKEELIKGLRRQFVNGSGAEASLEELSIREMLSACLPELTAASTENVIDNLNALYSDAVLSRMGYAGLDSTARGETLDKVLACCNSDGGFAWFPGMRSSRIVTAWVMATAARAGLEGIVRDTTVRYLDGCLMNAASEKALVGSCPLETYLYARSLYPQVPLNTASLDRKQLKQVRKDISKALIPSGDRGKQGDTFGKVRRTLTLNALLKAPELAREFGLVSTGKMRRSIASDMESLRQYAQPHKGGGMYWPGSSNQVINLLEGELQTHVMLCELFEGTSLADDIRMWIMLQKETQHWKSCPAYAEALACVQKASDRVLDTRVVALSASFTLTFDDIRMAANGFSIESECYKEGKKLSDGDTLKVGDRVRLVTKVSSDDMRSFVQLTVPRPANLLPVDQRSSSFWGGWYSVRADRTEYWFETCHEMMTLVEDCYVTAQGSFHSASKSIECLYAPHYRANEKASEVLVSRF